jgi:hypothetical protein
MKLRTLDHVDDRGWEYAVDATGWPYVRIYADVSPEFAGKWKAVGALGTWPMPPVLAELAKLELIQAAAA